MNRPEPESPLRHASSQPAEPPAGSGNTGIQALVAAASRTLCPDSGHTTATLIPAAAPPETVAATDHLSVRADWLQQQLGQGPLLSPADGVLVSPDLSLEERWPEFAAMAVQLHGLRSLLILQLPLGDADRWALTVYAERPDAFDGLSRSLAELSAARITPEVARLAPKVAALCRDEELSCLLPTALGLVMGHHRLPPGPAFDGLSAAARQQGVDLVDAAAEAIRIGRLPRPSADGADADGSGL